MTIPRYNGSLKVKKLTASATLPTRAHDTDAGYDLYADQITYIQPGELAIIHTGIALDLSGLMPIDGEIAWAMVRARSSTFRKGLMIQGTIDRDYCGEIMIQCWNISGKTIEVRGRDRLAQLILCSSYSVPVEEVQFLPETNRGDKGFGSSGR